MKHLVLLTRSLNFGGAERQLVTLANAIDKSRFKVTVVTFYGGPLENDIDRERVQVITLGKKGRWEVLGFLIRLARLLKKLKPDVLHGYLGTPNVLAVLFKPLLPGARVVWGVRASNMDLKRYDWLMRLHYRVECALSRFADLIIVNSRAGCEHAAKHGFPREKMIVIPNGIDTERFHPDAGAAGRALEEWKVAQGETLIGLVGRLDPMKDHPTFLRAASLFSSQRKDVRFVCIGNGQEPYKNEMMALAEQLGLSGRLIWAGSRNDMPAIYNALDILTSASLFGEGFSNVIGEAMASGVPCVVTDVGDASWIVGETGIVVPPNQPEALVEGWKRCLERNGGEPGAQARSRIENNFSVMQLVERTEAALWN
jgi:glycosyltransferase involved in cell wall biosynthesis